MKLNPSAGAILLSLFLAACSKESPESLLASARASLAKDDDRTAMIQAKNALQADPNSGEARFLLGSALLDGGDYVSAEVELRKAQSTKFSPDEVVPKLATTLLGEGQFKKLTDEFSGTRLSAAQPNANLQTSLAYAYAMLGNPTASQAALGAALAAAPDFVPALIMQVRLAAGKGEYDNALGKVESILQRDPKSADAWQLKGDLLYARNRAEEALAAYQKALSIKPSYQRAHVAIVSILLRQRKADEAEKQVAQLRKVGGNGAQIAYFDALVSTLRGDIPKARDQALQLLKAAPDNPNVLSLAGALELQRGSPLQAQRYLEHAIQVAPDSLEARRLLMSAYLRSSQPDKALAALSQAKSTGDIAPELYSVAAEAYLQTGDAKAAEDYFSRAAKLDPADASKRTSLAMARLSDGSSEAAVFSELQNISATDKGTSADMALISAYMQRSDTQKALEAIRVLEQKQPDKPLAPYLRGRVQLGMKSLAAARLSFDQASKLAPTYYPAIAGLAALDIQEGHLDEAKKRLQDALAKDPKNVLALTTLAQLAAGSAGGKDEAAGLLAKAIAADPTDISPRVYLVNLYLSNHDLPQATSTAQNAIAAIPDRGDLVDALGRVQMASGDLNQARVSFNKLIELQPDSPRPFMRLADAYVLGNNRDSAIESLRKALALKPDLVEAQRKLVTLYSLAGKFSEAFAVARTVQQQRPSSSLGLLLQGDVSANQKDWDKAATAYLAAIKMAPNSELAAKLDTVYTAANRDADAKKFQASWRKAHPTDAAFVFHLGDAAMARKDYATAEQAYLDVLTIQPKGAAALNNLAWVTNQQHKPGALAYAEQANQLAPNQPAFMDTLAGILADAKQFDKAIETQKRAIDLQPANPDLKLSLAKIYLKSGDKDGARVELNRLASLGTKFPAQAEVASILQAL